MKKIIGTLTIILSIYVNCLAQLNIINHTQTQWFVENKGQWDDSIKFMASLRNLNIAVTEHGLIFNYYNVTKQELHNKQALENDEYETFLKNYDTNIMVSGHCFMLQFPINLSEKELRTFEGINKLSAYYNFFIGKDSSKWRSFVGLYPEVYISNLIDGVNMRLYFRNGNFRYDLIANSPENLDKIKFKLIGIESLTLDENNDLFLKTSIGNIITGDILAYQKMDSEKIVISCKFSLSDHYTIGFELSDYDVAKPIIIDPVIFATLLGSPGSDEGWDIVADKSGCPVVTGRTFSYYFPTTSGAYSTTWPGLACYITKFNSILSSLAFSTFIGGNDYSNPWALDIGLNGDIVLTGNTKATNFPVTTGCFQNKNNGGYDIFISKLNSAGSSLLGSTYLGTTNNDNNYECKVDINGSVWVAGITSSAKFPVTSNAIQNKLKGTDDGFICKFDSLLKTLLFSSFIGGNGNDGIDDFDIDYNGNFYAVGNTSSTNFPVTSGCFQSSFETNFFIKINSFGNIVYASYYGSSSVNNNFKLNCLKVTSNGEFYLAGITSNGYTTTNNAFQKTFQGGAYDIFLTKINSNGDSILFSTYFGGNGNDELIDLAVDTFGNSFILGGPDYSSNFPTTSDAFIPNVYNPGANLVSISVLNNTGTGLIYSSLFDTSKAFNQEGGNFIDNYYNIYFSGTTWDTNFYVSSNAYQKYLNGGNNGGHTYPDAYALKMDLKNIIITTDFVDKTYLCAGDSLHIKFSCHPDLWESNYFIAQLSNKKGSFKNPINLGYFNDSTSGVIHARLPDNLVLGTNYRIRVISTKPYVIGSTYYYSIVIYPKPQSNFNDSTSLQCTQDNKFKFINSSSVSAGSIKSYLWDFGDSSLIDNNKNPVHEFQASGEYQVQLIAVSNYGCKDTIEKKVQKYLKPLSKFGISDAIQCFNHNKIIFTDSSYSNNGNLTYQYNFGDSVISLLSNPVHKYPNYGNYRTFLIVTDTVWCKDTSYANINILPSSVPVFSTNDSDQCFNEQNFKIYNQSTVAGDSITQYQWFLDTLVFSFSLTPILPTLKPGTYELELITSTSFNCYDTVLKKLVVFSSPLAVFSVGDTVQCFNEQSFIIRNQSTVNGDSITNLLWAVDTIQFHNFSDFNLSTLHKLSPGIWNLKLKATTSNGCSDSTKSAIYIFNSPNAAFDINDSSQCFNEQNFIVSNLSSVTGDSITQYHWFLNSRSLSISRSPTFPFFLNPGDNKLKLRIKTSHDCPDSTSSILTILPSPLASFSTNDTIQCLDSNSFVFTNLSSVSEGTMTFAWAINKTNFSTSRNPSIQFVDFGRYPVRLIATSDKGCPDTTSAMLYVSPNPISAFIYLNNCLEDTMWFFDRSFTDSGKVMKWFWDFKNGQNSVLQNPLIIYTDSGNKSVTLVSANNFGCSDDTTHFFRIESHTNAPVLKRATVVNNESVLVEWSRPKLGIPKTYHIERSDDNLNWYLLSDENQDEFSYLDFMAEIHSQSYRYRLNATDSCDYTGPYSNHGQTIYLIIDSAGPYPKLIWNAYREWKQGVNFYEVQVKSHEGFRTVSIIFQSAIKNPQSAISFTDSFTHDIADFYCYHIIAYRNGDSLTSTSNETCITTNFHLFIPNSFSPNNDGLNDVFRPKGAFINQYRLLIFNRWGEKLFESTEFESGWDGNFRNDKVPPGVYYYQIYVRGASGNQEIRKGSVVVLD